MLIKIFEGERVRVGSEKYRAQMIEAQTIASRSRQAGRGGLERWEDDYNDHSATGHFVVTARAPLQ